MNTKQLCRDFGMTRDDVYRERIRAITGRIAASLDYVDRKLLQYDEYDGIDAAFILRQIANEQAAMCKWAIERNHLLAVLKGDKEVITDAMIEQAREYPIDNLIEFDKGRATCFNHEDRRPSMTHNKKHNRAHCFVCGKSWDGIAVLQDRDGMRFAEAVKQLAGR